MTSPPSSQQPQCPFSTRQYHTVTNPSTVREILRDEERFAPTNALQSHHKIHPAALRELHRVGLALPPVLANQTGDKHRRVRKKLAPLFTKHQVRQWQPRYVEIVRDTINTTRKQAETHDTVDLARTVTGTPPTQLLLEIFHWPTDNMWDLKRWSDSGLELFWGEPSAERQVSLARDCADLYRWLHDEAVTGVDRYSQALTGLELSRKELLSLAFFLSIAGHQTTTYLANTTLTQALSTSWLTAETPAEHVDQWALLHTQQALRVDSSVPTWRRVVTQDTTLGHETFSAGEEVLVHLTGHHSPGVSVDGSSNQDFQLAFGLGPHRCLGAELAVMEVSTILAETYVAFPSLSLARPANSDIDLLSFRAPRQVWCSLATISPANHE